MQDYRIKKTVTEDDEFEVTFPDYPEITPIQGVDDDASWRSDARSALRDAIEARMRTNTPLPYASPAWVEETISLDARDTLKVFLYCLLKTNKMKQTELALKLGWSTRKMSEALDISNYTRTETLEEALAYFGYRAQIRLERLSN